MNKIGRPPKGENKKTIRYTIKLSKQEHQIIKEKAQKNGLSIAEYLRELALKDR